MALGMIEVYGFTTSIIVADKAAKSADVEIVAIDKNKPANGDSAEVPLVMVVKMEGTAAAVEAAMKAGAEEAKARGLYITEKFIARQSPEIEWFARLSATGKDKLRTPRKNTEAK
jgi:microcompartment protein CcmL/EutN